MWSFYCMGGSVPLNATLFKGHVLMHSSLIHRILMHLHQWISFWQSLSNSDCQEMFRKFPRLLRNSVNSQVRVDRVLCNPLPLINEVKNAGQQFQSIYALRYHRGNGSFFNYTILLSLNLIGYGHYQSSQDSDLVAAVVLHS